MIAPIGPNFRGYVLDYENVQLKFDERGWWVWSGLWEQWIELTASDVDDVLRAARVPYRKNLIYGAMRRVRAGLNDPNFGSKRGRSCFPVRGRSE